jgi:hypothetical protein
MISGSQHAQMSSHLFVESSIVELLNVRWSLCRLLRMRCPVGADTPYILGQGVQLRCFAHVLDLQHFQLLLEILHLGLQSLYLGLR